MRTAPPPPRSPVPPGRPPASSPAPPSPPFGARLAARRDDTPTPAAAELALVGLTVAAVIGLGRLFTDASFLPPVLAVVLAAHGLAWGARRLGVGPLGAVVVSAVGLLLALGWVVEPGTTTFGLPLAGTWQAIDADLRAAWTAFGDVRAPTAVTRGFVLAAAIGGWVAAFAADTFAFRARTRLEAVVPSFVLFLFGALIGAERNRLATTALYLAAVLVFVVLSEAFRRSGSSWFGGRAADGEQALVRSGLTMAMVATAAGLLVGPRLPGVRSPGVVDWLDGRDRGSSSRRVTPSPLVDIRGRLLDPSNAELFTVRADEPSYWRLTSLERYNGTTWSSSGSYRPARGRLPTDVPTRAPQGNLIQHFDIRDLSTIWLPAAYRPQRLDGAKGVGFDPDSSSLLTDAETPNGLRYSVQSALAQLDADDLAAASTAVPPDVAERYQDLPGDFPDDVRREAFRLTAADAATCQRLGCSPAERARGRLSPFHAARALQDHFRTNFRYSLNVRPGHDDRALQEFLFQTRRGYCEQFAGAFAAMARAIGLPSRVAVGFAPGTRGDDDGAFRVTGREAHAWPEVYLAGYGWVAFEPTPSRAIPGAEGYTGVTGPSAAAAPGEPDSTAPGTTAPSTVAPAPAPEPSPNEREEPVDPAAGSEDPGRRSLVPAFWPAILAAAALAYLAGVPLARRTLRSRRRRAAATPTERVLLAWQEAEEDLALAGLGRRPAETGPEYARRLEAAGGEGAPGAGVAARMAELAGHRSAAAFSPAGADEATAREAEAAAEAVGVVLRSGANAARRALWSLHPRPLAEAVSEAVKEKRKSLARRQSEPKRPRPA